jgi:hypothetical protein
MRSAVPRVRAPLRPTPGLHAIQYANEVPGSYFTDFREAPLIDSLEIREHSERLALCQREGKSPRSFFESPGIEVGHVTQKKTGIPVPLHTFSIPKVGFCKHTDEK